jgi:CRISPR-associated endonuclease Csn1
LGKRFIDAMKDETKYYIGGKQMECRLDMLKSNNKPTVALGGGQMKYRLGIDLGTSSIGIAAYSLGGDNNNEIQDLIYLDSYIFGEPVDLKVTKNTNRRFARLVRRQTERKAKRLRKISYIAKSIGVQKSDLDKIPGDKICELRAKAISQKIELPELIKVFCHIVKNRGYKGDLEISATSAEKKENKKVREKIEETKRMLKGKTLGELLYDKKLRAKEDNQPWRKLNQGGTFIERDFIEKEFELIWQEQAKHHNELKCNYKIGYQNMHCWNTVNGVKTSVSTAMFLDYKDEKEISLKEAFKSAMFYQRPIKWNLNSIGHCILEQDEFHSAKAQIAWQNHRLAKSISDLRIKNMQTKKEEPLTSDKKIAIYYFVLENYKQCNIRNEIPYSLIYEKLGLGSHERFSVVNGTKYNDKKEDGLKINTTLKCFYDLDKKDSKFIKAFEDLSAKSKELVLEFLSNITKYADIQEYSESSIDTEFSKLTQNISNQTKNNNKEAIDFIKRLRREEVFYGGKFSLEQGRGRSYSVKALEKLTPELLKGKNEQDIIEEIYHQKSLKQDSELQNSQLRDYEKIKTNNPVIDKCLREFKRIMDFVIKKFGGNPAEITIELTRDLKNSLAKRDYIKSQNDAEKEERTKAIKELRDKGVSSTKSNIDKYLLMQEQNGMCPYCGQCICISDIINKTQIDHIVPQSIGGPNILSNKVLAHTECNRDKDKKIPYELFKFKDDIDNYNKTRSINGSLINLVEYLQNNLKKEKKGYFNNERHWIYAQTQKAKRLYEKINFLLATPDNVKDLIGNFSNLDLQSTAYTSKIILGWCKDICPKVTPSFGMLTAYLRDIWNFNNILPEVRIAEGKTLFNEDGEEIDSAKWKEIFLKEEDWNFSESQALSQDFQEYIDNLDEEHDKPINNNTDKQKHFKKFRKSLRHENKFYKRIDHRHHAVDAAVIGLSTSLLIERASNHNKEFDGLYKAKDFNGKIKNPGFEIDNAELYRRIKEKTKEYLTDYVVWHKPDRLPNGKFFNETAYNRPLSKPIVQNCIFQLLD